MGLFGGVQVVGILCSIVRTKLVALWIGPLGVGLFGLFNQALDTINTAASLGVRQSSVRDISQAAERNEGRRLSRLIAVVRKWSLWLGLAGATLTLALAPLLSQWTFGSSEHLWGFVALSIAVLLTTLASGEQAVLQGLAKLRRLASVTLWGTVFGLVVSIPLFYFLREESILPSIIAYAAGCAFFALYFRDKEHPAVQVSTKDTVTIGRDFVRLGIYMTIGNFVTILAGYVFNAWLNVQAGTDEVGLYQAGYTLVYKYTGLVLTALGMEYYPRLSRVAGSRIRLCAFVSQEINIAMMVMAPIAALFFLLRGPVVWLLYSPEFNVVVTFASWVMMGTVMRAFSWCVAFVILAKGSGKIYLMTETLSAIIGLALNVVFYRLWGLTGLGVSFLAWYVAYSVIVLVVYVYTYRLRLTPACLFNLCYTLAITGAVFWAVERQLWLLAVALSLIAVVVSLAQAKRKFFG